MANTDYFEDALIEQPAIEVFQDLGWQTANCFYERYGGPRSTLGRETRSEVVLTRRLRQALEELNTPSGSTLPGSSTEKLYR